jgi:hypothetical protein
VTLLVVLLLSAPASSPAEAPDADQLLARGKRHFADGDFSEARRLLLEAARRARSAGLQAAIHLHLGLVHAAEKRSDEALRAFRAALTRDPRLRIDRRRYKAAFVELFGRARRATVGELWVSVDPPGDSVVVIDGKAVGRGTFRGPVLAGAHRVEIRIAGEPHRTRTVRVSAGESARVVILGRPPARAAAPKIPSDPPPPPKPRRLWTWIAAGGALVAVAIGIGTRLSATRDYDAGCDLLAGDVSCEERSQLSRPEDRPRYEDLRRSVTTKDTIAVVAFGTAAALAAAAPLLYWLEGRRTRTRQSVVPVAGARGLGLSLSF